MRRILASVALCVFTSACSSNFHETHYFRETDATTGEAVNYFRITVSGNTTWARSRYVSGYYDERAVDLFFNEIKSDTATAADIKPIFGTTLVDPGTTNAITPLSPGTSNGAFIMFFSSNAKAVSDAIGGFAENQVVADAVTNIINRDAVRAQQRQTADQAEVTKRNTAVLTELESLFGLLPAATETTTDRAAVTATYVRILNAIARSLGANEEFASIQDGQAWLEQQSATIR